MPLHASWIHGNAVQVENPENLQRMGHFGWGADMDFIDSTGTWLHVPLPTPVIVGGVRTTIDTIFLMFKSEHCQIQQIHVYDGASKVGGVNQALLTGDHLTGLDGWNTHHIVPHTVLWGMGISFFVQASIMRNVRRRLIVGAAGGDFKA